MMIESTDSAKPMTAPRTRAQRKRAAAEATARWRGMRIALGMPEAHAVDRALSEAMAFCLKPRFSFKDGEGSVYISMNRVFRVATLLLVRNGADRVLAQRALTGRLQPRKAHRGAHNVPSLAMADANFVPSPRRRDLEWEEHDQESMRIAAAPLEITQYDGVTGVFSGRPIHDVTIALNKSA